DAGSAFTGGVYYAPPFTASFQSKSRTVAFATQVVLDEMKKMTEAPVTNEELDTAKRSFIDTFPQHFTTKAQTANTFAGDEFTGRFQKHPDFYQKWRSRIDAVSVADVERVAKEHLHPDQVRILVVGQKDEILKGHPDHPNAEMK